MAKRFWKRLGRGGQIAVVLLAITVFSVSAWAGILWFTGQSSMTVGVAPPPDQPISVSIHSCDCTGADAPVCEVDGNTVSLTTANFMDTSSCSLGIFIENTSGQPAYFSVLTSPSNPAFDYTNSPDMTINGNGERYFGISGNSETITVAGTTVSALEWTFEVDDTP